MDTRIEPIMIDAALVSAQRRKRLFWVGKLVGDKYEQVTIPQPEDRGIFLKDILESGVSDDKSFCIDASYWKGGNEKQHFTKGRRTQVFPNDSVYHRRTYWRETKGDKVPTLTANMGTGGNNVSYIADKSYCIPATFYKENIKSLIQRKKKGLFVTQKSAEADSASNCKNDTSVSQNFRKLTPIECERLQSLPDNYTAYGKVLQSSSKTEQLVSKMEHTTLISSTQRYKCLGNAFNVDVVAHILKHIEIEKTH